MKKRWLLALFLALCCVLCACGADGDAVLYADESHEHVYGFWYDVSAPTCAADGEQVRYCKICHESEQKAISIPEDVAERDHAFVDTVVPPTATEPGFVSRSCSACQYTVRLPYERTGVPHTQISN